MTSNIPGRDGDDASTTSTGTIELSAGGFAPDTEVITATGPTRVSELSAGDRVYTLDLTTHLARLKRVTGVQQVVHDGDLVALETNRCNLHVHPDHRMVCRTISWDELEIRTAETIEAKEHYKLANDWRTLPGQRLDDVDITDLIDDYEMCVSTDVHGHTVRAQLPDECEPVRRNGDVGYCFEPATFKAHQEAIESIAEAVFIHAGPNHHRRPYRFDGDDFVEFLGWFVTEGSTTWSASSDTIEIQIAQQDETHRPVIRDLFDRMGFAGPTNSYSFKFASKLYGQLLESLCGTGSHEKHLPEFVWGLSADQQRLLYETLLAGDGNDRGTYYTASDRLSGQLCRLVVELGLKPRRTLRQGTWRVCGRDVKDGFTSSQNVRRVDSPGTLYRLTVEDDPSVMAGRDGVFQWVGVSRVS